MAGGVLKGSGVTLLVLGVLMMVVGIVVAAFGGYVANEEDNKLVGDREKAEGAIMFAIGGLVGAGVGLVLAIIGGILMAAGGARARREMLVAIGARPAIEAPTATQAGGHGKVVAAVVVAALMVAGVVAAVAALGEGGGTRASSGPSTESGLDPLARTFDGRVVGARAPVVGGVNPQAAIHEMDVGSGSGSVFAMLNWTVEPGGAGRLRILLETGEGDAWEEIAQGEGAPGFVVESPDRDLLVKVRARVFLADPGAADQSYELVMGVRR